MPSEAWFRTVPLGIPLPPTDRPWTSLLEVFGLEAVFGPARFSEALLDDLLRSVGREVQPDEHLLLRWTTPVPAGPSPTERLLGCLTRPSVFEAVEVLGRLGEDEAVEPLRSLLGQVRPGRRGPIWVALARLGIPGEGLLDWDQETVADQLLARVLLGDPVEEVPPGLPEALERWLETRAAEDLPAVLADLEAPFDEVVGLLSRRMPDGELLSHLPEVACLAVRLPVWAERLGASAGLEAPLLELLDDARGQVRSAAAQLLGELPSLGTEAIVGLQEAATEGEPDVRREATLALARHGADVELAEWTEGAGYPARVAAVAPGLTGPPVTAPAFLVLHLPAQPELCSRLLFSLALEDPGLHAALFEAIAVDAARDQPLPYRQAAAAASLLAGVPPTRLPELFRVLLRSEGGAVASPTGCRQEALLALAARDADWEVRLNALVLAAVAGPLDAQRPLLEILASSDTDPSVRAQAEALLSPAFRADDLGTLLRDSLVQDPRDEHGRARALTRLAEVDPERARLVATAFRGFFDRRLVVVGSRVLGRLTPPEEAGPVARRTLAELTHPSWVRREAGAALLGSLPVGGLGEALTDELAEALEVLASDDEDDDVRRAAAWAALQLRRG